MVSYAAGGTWPVSPWSLRWRYRSVAWTEAFARFGHYPAMAKAAARADVPRIAVLSGGFGEPVMSVAAARLRAL